MLRKLFVSTLIFGTVSPVHAEGMGMICRGKATIILAPDIVEVEQCAARHKGPCKAGFSTPGGYFAVAQSPNGRASGLAGGHRSARGAEAKALYSCEKLGAGGCEIVQAGLDDGETRLNCG